MVMGELSQDTEVLVIGGGSGGIRGGLQGGRSRNGCDHGGHVAERPGGACVYRGCIPSKALLFMAELLHDTRRVERMGITFGEPELDLERIRKWKNEVVDQLADGLVTLSEKRGIQRIQGRAFFENSNEVRLQDSEVRRIRFRHAILATGSHPRPHSGPPL